MLFRIYQIFILAPVVALSTAIIGTIDAIICSCTGWLKNKLPFSMGIMTRPDWWTTHLAKIWSRIIIRTSLLHVEVNGRENIPCNTSCVFTANHQGAYDIFLICGYLNVELRWMMKRSLEKIPFFGTACKHAGEIFVDKGSNGKVLSTYRNAEHALKEGASIMVFPEGARTKNGHMLPFHRGAFALADELQLPVIPMTINGSYDILPKQQDGKFIKRHTLSLTIHKPIYPISKGNDNINWLTEESYKVINSAVEDKYRN